MTMSEVEVDRITQQVFAARNSGLDAALVKVVIDEIEKATTTEAMLATLVERGVLEEEHGYMPVDESGERWHMRPLERALQDAKDNPCGDTYGDGAPRPGIVTIEHGVRHHSAWRLVDEVHP